MFKVLVILFIVLGIFISFKLAVFYDWGYVKEHNNSKNAKKYLKANKYFNDALNDIENKSFISFIKNGLFKPFFIYSD